MRTAVRFAVTLLCSCFVTVLVLAQQGSIPQEPTSQQGASSTQQPSPSQTQTPPQSAPPEEVSPGMPPSPSPAADHRIWLDVVVTDKSGNPISGLQQQDFTILDSKQPDSILSFRATDENSKSAEPLQVIFLVDAVNTGVQSVGFERDQLDKFLRQNGGQLPLPGSMFVFTDKGTQLQTPTRDGNALADFLKSDQSGLRTITRSQGFYGAVDRLTMSIRTIEQLTVYESKQPGRKLVIWISPGWPLLSGPRVQLSEKNEEWLFNTIVGLSRAMREARVTLYSVDPLGLADAVSSRTFYYEEFLKGVPSANKVQSGNVALQVLATQTGGRVLNSSNDITRLLAECLADAKAYYTLSFEAPPADHPNEYHSLEVKVDKPGLIARTRTGYYAQPYKGAGRGN
jgi:VWFA-related protein